MDLSGEKGHDSHLYHHHSLQSHGFEYHWQIGDSAGAVSDEDTGRRVKKYRNHISNTRCNRLRMHNIAIDILMVQPGGAYLIHFGTLFASNT